MLRNVAQMYLRVAVGVGFFWFGLDRLGAWGSYGKPWVSWGDWKHFSPRAHALMYFLPYNLAEVMAVAATCVEVGGGFLLIIGWRTRWAAFACSGLAFCFATAMAVADGIVSPLGYSVFTVSAASLLLATLQEYGWSVDMLLQQRKMARVTRAHS